MKRVLLIITLVVGALIAYAMYLGNQEIAVGLEVALAAALTGLISKTV
jgi:uncharacterized membrane protein